MNTTTGLLLLLLLLCMSLATVSVVNRWQTRNRMIRQKIAQLNRRIGELEEVRLGIEPLLESNLIPRLVNEEVMDLIQSIQRLDPDSEYLGASLEHARQLEHQFNEQKRGQALNRMLPSDASIAQHHYYLEEAARIVRRHHALGRLQRPEMEDFIHELVWAKLMVGVISHVAQGHRAAARKDYQAAYNYYRRAQNILIGHPSRDERRHQLIRELADIIADRRQTFSRDVVPEYATLSTVAN